MKRIKIYGAGGLGREVATYLREQDPQIHIEFVVDPAYFNNEKVDDIPVVLDSTLTIEDHVIIAIGDPVQKSKVFDKINAPVVFSSIVHTSAYIAPDTVFGEGVIVSPGVVISIRCMIGRHGLLNYNCTLGHDVKLGDFVSVFPGATISGNVNIGDRVMIGANSSIKEGVTITSDVKIGMGAVVLGDILEPGTYVGNPVRRIR